METYIIVGFSTKRNGVLAFLTRFFTRWRHSHIVLINKDRIIEATDAGGVREMPLSYLLGRDDVEIRKIYHPKPELVWLHAKTQIGKPYDELYSWGWLFNRNWQDDASWACTELIEWCCRKAGYGVFPANINFISTRDFYLISK